MSLKSKIIISIVAIFVIFTAVIFFKKRDISSVEINKINNELGVNTSLIYIKSNNVVHIKCIYKNAGVLHNLPGKHGISAILGDLFYRKINGSSHEETKEKLLELGVKNLSVRALEDDFIISFYMLKDKAEKALKFLSFSKPEFSKNDLEHIKRRFPRILDPDLSHPTELLFGQLLSMLYTNHNYGLNNTGTASDISSITEKDIYDFIKSNFSKDNLCVFFSGDISELEVKSYVKTLFSRLQKKRKEYPYNTNMSLSGVTEEKTAKIYKKNMKDIVGVICGIRIDHLNKIERAAVDIIIKTLFDKKIGDFASGLRSRNILYNVDYCFIKRRLSNIFYVLVYIDKKDLASYQKYLDEKISTYYKKLDLTQLNKTKGCLIIQSQNNFTKTSNLEEKVKYRSLPFSDVSSDVFINVASKLFDTSKMRTVYIISPF